MNINTTFDVPFGAFIFMGQVESENNTYVKGNFISKSAIIKSLTNNTIILKFMKPLTSRRTEREILLNDRLE
jgi:hypoxanthine-guanine phosphoribosyltransferase